MRLHKIYHYRCYNSLNTLIEVQSTTKVESEHKLLPPEAIRDGFINENTAFFKRKGGVKNNEIKVIDYL